MNYTTAVLYHYQEVVYFIIIFIDPVCWSCMLFFYCSSSSPLLLLSNFVKRYQTWRPAFNFRSMYFPPQKVYRHPLGLLQVSYIVWTICASKLFKYVSSGVRGWHHSVDGLCVQRSAELQVDRVQPAVTAVSCFVRTEQFVHGSDLSQIFFI